MKAIAVAFVLVAISGGRAPAQAEQAPQLSPRTNYMERCGGCHGLEGRSASTLIPDLKDRAGYYLCNSQSRDYMGRLPNVVFSEISDEDLAALLNYVAFELGARSVPPNALRYSAPEIARMRRSPLTTTDLVSYRKKVVERLISDCQAPKSLRTEYAPRRAQMSGLQGAFSGE